MNAADWVWLQDGGVTSPLGFVADGVCAGIKTYGPEPRLDVALLASERACAAAGVFTQNQVCGAPLVVCKERLQNGGGRAIVVNAGCSNVATGAQGLRDARRMAELGAERVGIRGEEVFVASTGVIGRALPLAKIADAIPKLSLARSVEASALFARAIMTTDTVPKSRALQVRTPAGSYTIGGAAKGAGMVHPNMATVLCFVTTDAAVEPGFLQQTLSQVVDQSLNMLDVDMDTSTSDTMLLLANGAAGGPTIAAGTPAAAGFTAALRALAIEFTRDLARDGEGAKTLLEVTVADAASESDARAAARTVVSSPLVKTMITGRDANLGRVLMALGRSGARIQLDTTSVFIGEHCAFARGVATDIDYAEISRAMDRPEVKIRVELGLGSASATAWGCDLTSEYVRINGEYTT